MKSLSLLSVVSPLHAEIALKGRQRIDDSKIYENGNGLPWASGMLVGIIPFFNSQPKYLGPTCCRRQERSLSLAHFRRSTSHSWILFLDEALSSYWKSWIYREAIYINQN